MELQNELYDERRKDFRRYWFSLDFKKAGGQMQLRVIAISEVCTPGPRLQVVHVF